MIDRTYTERCAAEVARVTGRPAHVEDDGSVSIGDLRVWREEMGPIVAEYEGRRVEGANVRGAVAAARWVAPVAREAKATESGAVVDVEAPKPKRARKATRSTGDA